MQLVLLNERGRLLRFLAARGAGDEAEDVLQDLWQRVAAAPAQPIAEPLSYLFRAAENMMRDRRRSNASRERRQHAWHEAGPTPQEQPSGERALIARQNLREVDRVLAALGPRVDRVFRRYRVMRYTRLRLMANRCPAAAAMAITSRRCCWVRAWCWHWRRRWLRQC